MLYNTDILFFYQTIRQILLEKYCESESEQTDVYCQSSENEDQDNSIHDEAPSSVDTSITCDLGPSREIDTSELTPASVTSRRVSYVHVHFY